MSTLDPGDMRWILDGQTISLHGILDRGAADSVQHVLEHLQCEAVFVDMSNVRDIDEFGVATLLTAKRLRPSLTVVNPSLRARARLEARGILEYLTSRSS